MAGYYQFGPDTAATPLPADFQACIQNPPTPACDATVGSVFTGSGYCSEDLYKQTTYCSCVNSALPCPAVTSTVCTSSPGAYHATSMVAGSTEFENCLATPVCLNVLSVGGSQNVVEASQSCGVGDAVANAVRSRPGYAAAFVLVLVALLVAVASRPEDGAAGGGDGVAGGGESGAGGAPGARRGILRGIEPGRRPAHARPLRPRVRFDV